MIENNISLKELSNKFDNLIRIGRVKELSSDSFSIKVTGSHIADKFIPLLQMSNVKTNKYSPPVEGEKVIVFNNSILQFALRGITLDDILPKGANTNTTVEVYDGGMEYKYDHNSNEYTLSGVKNYKIETDEKLELNSTSVVLGE